MSIASSWATTVDFWPKKEILSFKGDKNNLKLYILMVMTGKKPEEMLSFNTVQMQTCQLALEMLPQICLGFFSKILLTMKLQDDTSGPSNQFAHIVLWGSKCSMLWRLIAIIPWSFQFSHAFLGSVTHSALWINKHDCSFTDYSYMHCLIRRIVASVEYS